MLNSVSDPIWRRNSLEKMVVVFWGLCLTTLLWPYPPVNSWAFLGLVVLSLGLFYENRGWEKRRFITFHIYYLIPFFVLLLSLIFVSRESIAVMEKQAVTICFPAITFFLLNSNYKVSKQQFRVLLACFALAVLFVLVFTYIRSFFYSDEFFAHDFLTFGIIHPTYFSFYCGITILIILELGKEWQSMMKYLSYVVIVCVLLYMILLSSRMPIIATFIVLVISLFFSPMDWLKKLGLALGFSVLISLMGYIVYTSPRLNYRFIEALQKNLNTRMVSWKASLAVFREYPLLGTGTGKHLFYLDNVYKATLEDPTMYLSFNAHNYFLHILMTFGVIGSAVMCLFWFKILSVPIVYRFPFLTKCLLLFLLCSMTEVMLETQKGIVFFYVFYSLNVIYVLGQSKMNVASMNAQ